MRLMRDAAARHPRVLREPAPDVLIRQFADNGIELERGVGIEDPEQGRGRLRSDLYTEIWRAFQAQGIERYPTRSAKCACWTRRARPDRQHSSRLQASDLY